MQPPQALMGKALTELWAAVPVVRAAIRRTEAEARDTQARVSRAWAEPCPEIPTGTPLSPRYSAARAGAAVALKPLEIFLELRAEEAAASSVCMSAGK